MFKKKRNNKKPEENIRQFIIEYLISKHNFKNELFRIEKKIDEYTEMKIRPDVVVYDSNLNPFMIIECKANTVKISDDALYQVAKYNKILKAKYILITNGIRTYCWKLCKDKYIQSDIPNFEN